MNTVQASHLRGWWMLCTAPWSFLLNNIIIRGKRGHIWRPYPSFFSWNLDCVMRNGQLACNQSLWTDRKRLSVYGIHWQLPPALNLKQMSEPQKKNLTIHSNVIRAKSITHQSKTNSTDSVLCKTLRNPKETWSTARIIWSRTFTANWLPPLNLHLHQTEYLMGPRGERRPPSYTLANYHRST